MEQADDLYRIGTVAKLTGITVERLRAWERRFSLAPASKVGKTRFYSSEQVHWLQSVKALLDQGQPISSLIDLSQQQLDERITPAPEPQPGSHSASTTPAEIALIGTNLLLLEQRYQRDARVLVKTRTASIDTFLERYGDLEAPDHGDVIVVLVPTLTLTPLEQLQDISPSSHILVLYEFALPAHLESARERGFDVQRWPLSWRDIESRAARGAGKGLIEQAGTQRRYSDEELIAIAGTSTDPNECPRHLSELITRLNAFCDYTEALTEDAAQFASAVDRLDAGPAMPAKALYQRLHSATAQARATLEAALSAAAEAEGIAPQTSAETEH
ncbi:MAG: helix-turn-helix domain-containing protein [Pseudomonadales bacterium]